VVPTLQSIHIIAVAFVLTSSFVLAGRAWNLVGTDWTLARWGRRLLPWLWLGLTVLLATGVLLVLAEPARALPNRSFQLKMMMLVAALVLALRFARRVPPSAGRRLDGWFRAAAALLVLLWLGIIAAARWIGYT
jgi:cytochrome bd-type quinol oxidase subunit 2